MLVVVDVELDPIDIDAEFQPNAEYHSNWHSAYYFWTMLILNREKFMGFPLVSLYNFRVIQLLLENIPSTMFKRKTILFAMNTYKIFVCYRTLVPFVIDTSSTD